MRRAGLLAAAAGLLLGASPSGRVDLGIDGLRSKAGWLRICLTTRADRFPDCQGDPQARRLSVKAGDAEGAYFDDLPSGAYAVALFHDENGNGKLDTRFGIPTEGMGFSRNPRILFGPPRFAAAEFPVAGGETAQRVKLRYFL